MKKRLLALFLVLVLVLGTLAACGNQTEEAPKNDTPKQEQPKSEEPKQEEPKANLRKTTTSQAENALRIVINSDIHTLDWHHYALANEWQIMRLIYDTPMVQTEEGWDPWLFTKMEPNADGSAVECEIRDDVYFASGDKMTMEDILYSLRRCEISVACPYLYANSNIEVIDDTHFIWNFPNPDMSYFVQQADANTMPIFNKSFCESITTDPLEDLLFNVDGTGAYKLEGPLTAGIHDVTLVKNDKYWNTDGYMDKIIFKYVSGDTEIAFESGDIDITSYRAMTLDHILAYDNVASETQFSGSTYMLILNCTEASPFQDITVREAFQYSFDRETVGMVACEDGGEVAWHLITPACDNWVDVVPHRTLDEAKAKQLMTQAGYSASNPCKITLFAASLGNWISALEVLKEDLDKCYFDCSIEEATDTTRYFGGDFDVALIGIGFSNDFGSYGMVFDPDTGLCLSGYEDKDLALRIAQAITPEDAKQALIDFDAAMAYIPISYTAVYYVFDANLEPGPFVNSYNLRNFRWK